MTDTIIHQWFRRIWNEGDRNAVYELLARNGVIHGLNEDGSAAHGPEEFLAFFDRFHAAMPDTRVEVKEVVVSGKQVVGRWTVTATHTGDHMGFPATNNIVLIEGMSMATTDDQGRIAEGWNYWDRLALMKQLGFEIQPRPAAAAS